VTIIAAAAAITSFDMSGSPFMVGLRIGEAHTQSVFIGNFGLTRSLGPFSEQPRARISAWLLLLLLV
jgi:hypothetical protein